MKTNKLIAFIIVAIFVANCSNKKSNTPEEPNENLAVVVKEEPIEANLFDRLGGTEGISSLVDDIAQAHLENPVITHVFLPLKENPAHFDSFKTHVKEFLSAGTGGGATYTGKDLPSAHKGLNSTEREFLSAVDDILMVMSKHNIDEETKKNILYILYSIKGAVIGQ